MANEGANSLEIPPTTPAPGLAGFQPPPVEQLARLFPQLEILELLGKGGMGAVYKARQLGLDRFVAVKILPPEVGRDPLFAERFMREARAMAKLSHPHIVAVHDFGQTSGLFYFVMEFIDGANLRQTLRAGKLQAAEALAIVPQICDALQYAHDEGIVHRDIKPENILLDKRGRVKIADFGLSKLVHQGTTPDVSLTGTEQVMGTVRYMAPEQMLGTRFVDHRADIYSLGVVFYELLTGDVPMGRFEPPSKKVQVDVRLDEVVLRALAQEPEKRYQHASDVKTDVEIVRGDNRPVVRPIVGQAEDEVFPIRVHVRDFKDVVAALIAAPFIFGFFWLTPTVLIFLALLALGFSGESQFFGSILGGALVFLGTFAVLSSGSVESVRVSHDGLTINRHVGPSVFLPWSIIRRIEPMSRGEVVRQVFIWPGLPPRGSIVCMAAGGFYRINCSGDCWYFNPRDAEAFLAAIERAQRGEARSSGSASPSSASRSGPSVAEPRPMPHPAPVMTASGDIDLDAIRQAVRIPAIGLIVTGVLACLSTLIPVLMAGAFFLHSSRGGEVVHPKSSGTFDSTDAVTAPPAPERRD